MHQTVGSLWKFHQVLDMVYTSTPGVHNLIAIAGRIKFIFMNYDRHSVQDAF